MSLKLSKLFSLSLRDWVVLARAWWLFVYVDWVVSKRAYERWPAWMRIDDNEGQLRSSPAEYGNAEITAARAEEFDAARHIIYLSEIAGRYNVSYMNCLRRCIVQRALLQRLGIASELRLGVRKDGPVLAAHSWLTLHDHVLNDAEDVAQRYAQLEPSAERALQQLLF